jgi:Phage tail tube protein
MPPGIGATGFIGIAPETVMGTYVAPTLFVPVLTDDLKYTESKYYSQQLRQQVVDSDVKPGYYHIEGTIELEVDTNNFLYFLYATRHTIVKTGAGPYTYKFTPSTAGSTSTGSGAVQRTLSITSVKNGIVFGHTGCTVSQYVFTINNGVLVCTMTIIGLGEAVQSLPTASWIAPDLLGADSHNVFTGPSGVTPTFAQVFGYNGFTFTVNHNAQAENRIQSQRSANYVKFGKTDFTVNSDLDFIDRTDYDSMKSSATQAIKLESTVGGTAFSGATDGIQLQVNRAAFDTYDIPSTGMGDIIMATFVGHGLSQVGGDGYAISVKSAVSIT